MLAVLAYAHDRSARGLVDRWRAAGEDAGVLTCADLSRRGWIHRPGDPAAGRAVVDGRTVATSDLRGVLIRMPAAAETELPHVHESDRAYASSEMQAFLLAWLSSLRCPVLNRPTIANLGGPAWHTAEWVRRARRLGLAARPVTWTGGYAPNAPPDERPRPGRDSVYVDVVAGRAFLIGGRAPGPEGAPFADAALALARDAEVEVMRAYFDRTPDGTPRLLDAGLWIDLAADGVAEALTERFLGFVHARPGAAPRPLGVASA